MKKIIFTALTSIFSFTFCFSQDTITKKTSQDIQSTVLENNDNNISSADLFTQGQTDASKYYKGYKGAGTGTLITSLLSPLVGLIPAIATSSTQPQDINLNYPNADLMKKSEYNNGYSQKSRKIKQGKVWKNWGIGFGVNLVAVLLLMSGSGQQ